jgi:catechol 2,3-dioxygenase-like lactoylglutathione lyase family enzyme
MTEEKKLSMISRRTLLQALGAAAVAAPVTAFGQGRCIRSFGSPDCNTSPIAPVFAPTGWKTVSLDHLTFRVADYQKEAAFYQALMGWKLRSDDGKQAIMDIGTWGSVIFQQAPASAFATGSGEGRPGGRGPVHAIVDNFCFAIDPWDAKSVAAELRKRGMTPVADNGPGGFESFHVKDLDGFDLQISNANGLTKARRTSPPHATLSAAEPFASTGWQTVWLDHLSFGVHDYKKAVSFYTNLLGWKPTYDEGSQNECMIGEVGDIIIRGGNPLAPNFATEKRRTGLDHISFGISPWDTDKVKEDLEKRGLAARVDTSTGDEIHVAAFKSYHTFTPNGYNLQVSYVTHDKRLTLANAVRPKPTHQR